MNENQAVPSAPPRIRRGQRIALALLMASGIVNYLDRGTLAVASSAIRNDLGLSLAQMGLLLSAFSWSYALCQFPVGGLVDRIGPRRLLGIGLIVWSFAQAAGGIVGTFGWFIVARIVLGIGEAPQFPSAARVVSALSSFWTGAQRVSMRPSRKRTTLALSLTMRSSSAPMSLTGNSRRSPRPSEPG